MAAKALMPIITKNCASTARKWRKKQPMPSVHQLNTNRPNTLKTRWAIFTGIISGVTEWGMYVEIIENKCEGMIRLRDISDDFYTLDEKNYAIIGQRKKKIYQLGDEVRSV
jgi:exoribonuclease R